jgi:hypothetical protein
MDRVLSMIASLLKRANDAGETKIDNPDLTARLVMAPVVFSALWQAVFNQKSEADVDLNELFALHEQMMLRALQIGTTP